MIMCNTYFSWDMTKKEKEEYRKQYPLFKTDEHGMLMRRTHLIVLKQRLSKDGKEYSDGYAFEAGYNYVTGELLAITWIGCVIYAAYRVFMRFK